MDVLTAIVNRPPPRQRHHVSSLPQSTWKEPSSLIKQSRTHASGDHSLLPFADPENNARFSVLEEPSIPRKRLRSSPPPPLPPTVTSSRSVASAVIGHSRLAEDLSRGTSRPSHASSVKPEAPSLCGSLGRAAPTILKTRSISSSFRALVPSTAVGTHCSDKAQRPSSALPLKSGGSKRNITTPVSSTPALPPPPSKPLVHRPPSGPVSAVPFVPRLVDVRPLPKTDTSKKRRGKAAFSRTPRPVILDGVPQPPRQPRALPVVLGRPKNLPPRARGSDGGARTDGLSILPVPHEPSARARQDSDNRQPLVLPLRLQNASPRFLPQRYPRVTHSHGQLEHADPYGLETADEDDLDFINDAEEGAGSLPLHPLTHGYVSAGTEKSEGGGDWRAALRQVTGYDPSKFRDRDQEQDDQAMESSYAQLQREERRAAAIAAAEDAQEWRRLQNCCQRRSAGIDG